MFVALAILWKPLIRGTGGDIDRPVGIAVVHQTNNGSEYFVSGGGSSQATSNTSQNVAAALPNVKGASPLEDLISDLLPNESALPNAASGADTVGNGLSGSGTTGVSGKGSGDFGKGPKTETSFLGVKGSGASFVYVLDRSDSMNINAGAPMFVAKRELMNSIDSLKEGNQFQVVFYNDAPVPLASIRGISNRMMFATETDKNRAKQFVRGMTANGGTEHLAAIKAGLSFAPEVLFFMTDADEPRLTDAQMQYLQELATRTKTTIHSIEFRSGLPQGDGGWIRILAEQTRGTYRFVNVDDLRVE
jgi:hypothetical protein